MNLKKYYSSQGNYLKEHKNYFSEKQLQKDVNFLIDVLNLKKNDKILDLACGHGRHTIELVKKGYNIDGLDFSSHLLKIAKETANQNKLRINFYNQNIHNINLREKYNKIFLFFSEFGLFNADKAISNISKILKTNGLFLLDCDNVFRLIQYLIKNPKSPYFFNFHDMELIEKRNKKTGVRYYVLPELKNLFHENGLKLIKIFGDYQKNNLDINSKRIILVGKKVKII